MYMYIYLISKWRERERAVIFDTYSTYIYTAKVTDIATKLPSVEPFCTHILKPARKFTRELPVFLGVCMHGQICQAQIEMFSLK